MLSAMCGRVVQALPPEQVRRLFKVSRGERFNVPPRWNGAPTDRLMVVRRDPASGENSLDLIRWGLVPHFARDMKIGASLINARCESVAIKAAFRGAWAKNRRCLIPIDGFYEWRREGKTKQPYAIALKDGTPMALAGLWENWKDPATGEWTRTFTVLTTEPNSLIAPFHDRMPVIVPIEDQERWLAGDDATDLLCPLPAELLEIWAVSVAVNKVGVEGVELWGRLNQ
ncbi:SOS response-associated peptidase [Terrihabitans sp. B22-R8]|uniref:SOS response-associated peptidase n=1 Tax=Terrihabitans sp. B22-R8 TaxID=3425128 RepID=UPI00403D53C5